MLRREPAFHLVEPLHQRVEATSLVAPAESRDLGLEIGQRAANLVLLGAVRQPRLHRVEATLDLGNVGHVLDASGHFAHLVADGIEGLADVGGRGGLPYPMLETRESLLELLVHTGRGGPAECVDPRHQGVEMRARFRVGSRAVPQLVDARAQHLEVAVEGADRVHAELELLDPRRERRAQGIEVADCLHLRRQLVDARRQVRVSCRPGGKRLQLRTDGLELGADLGRLGRDGCRRGRWRSRCGRRPVRCGRDRTVGRRRRWAQLLKVGPLVGKGARKLETGDAALRHQRLADALPGLALRGERTLQLLGGHEALLDEDLPDRPSVTLIRRGRGRRLLCGCARHRLGDDGLPWCASAFHLFPLLGQDARELETGHAEVRDEHLTEAFSALLLDLERALQLLGRHEAALDEHGPNQAGRGGRRFAHVLSIGSPSFEV